MNAEQIDAKIKSLPRHKRDWLEIYGDTFAAKKVMPGTCEACVYGSGEHSETCERARASCWRKRRL